MTNDSEANDYLSVGKCEYCDQYLVVMSTRNGSVLPVEVENKSVKINDDEVFESDKYKSHLLNCEKQREAWEMKKKKYIKQRNPLAVFGNLTLKELTR
jgi:hypothetical protein